VEFLHDDIADVAYRFILSPFVGYYFIKSPETRLRGEVGPAFIAERVGGNEHQFIALRLSERFERDLSKTAKIWEQVDYFPHVDDFGNYLLNAEIGVEAAMNAQLSLRVVVQNKFNSQPPAGRERNDLSILASLVYNFGKAK
jgi:putative salt-induced outer membrane protein YdiY